MRLRLIFSIFFVILLGESNCQETCGKQTPLSSISAGAKHTVRGEHPWKVALINEDGNFICGGTLISNKAIVTAAQCIQKKDSQQPLEPEDLSVVLAAQDLSKVLEKGRVVVGVKSIHIHPDFNTDIGSFEGDVALLILDSEVQFNSYIQPICLSKPLSSSVQETEGIVVGHQKVEGKNVAKKFETSIKSYHKCTKEKSYLKPYLDARTVCGTYHDCAEKNWPTDVDIDIRFEFESSDIECGAAIGSGLYVLHNNRYYLRGITVASSYGIFVNTAEYCGWIQSGGLNKYAHCTENDFTTTTQKTTTKKLTTTQPAIIQPPPVVTTTTQKPTKTSLLPNECLYSNDFLQTTNKCFKLIYQGDGNLVIYRTSSNQHTWHTQTHGTCTKYACMQGDGNFVVYDCNNVAKWNSHTHGNPGARLELQIDGNLVVYSTGNVALWNSGTVTHC